MTITNGRNDNYTFSDELSDRAVPKIHYQSVQDDGEQDFGTLDM